MNLIMKSNFIHLHLYHSTIYALLFFVTTVCYGQNKEITLSQSFKTSVGDASIRITEYLNSIEGLTACEGIERICYTGELIDFGSFRENGEKKSYSAPFTLRLLVDTKVTIHMTCPYVNEERIVCNRLQEKSQTILYDDNLPYRVRYDMDEILEDIADNIQKYVNKNKRNEIKFNFDSSKWMDYIVDGNSITYFAVLKSEKGLSKEELFRIAESFFTYHYRSGKDVIQSKDPERLSITGTGVFGDVNHINSWGRGTKEDYSAPHIVTIDCRDGRVRASVTINQLDVVMHGNQYIKSKTYSVNLSQYVPFGDDNDGDITETIIKLESRIKSLFDSIQKSIDEGNTPIDAMDDW